MKKTGVALCTAFVVIILAGCSEKNDEKLNVTYGETKVSQLFKEDLLLYYMDTDNKIIYGVKEDFESIKKRLNVTMEEGGAWFINIGPINGIYTVKSSHEVDNSLTVTENHAAGIKGYTCRTRAAGTCLRNRGTKTSSKLVNTETLCTSPNAICDAIWGKIPVDYYANSTTCKGVGVRKQENNALCLIP